MSKTLYDYGTLFRVRISRWSFRATNKQNEFGVDDKFVETRAITSFGVKLLAPKSESDAFLKIEHEARNVLYKYGHPFDVADAWFIPLKNVESVKEELQKHRVNFMNLVDSFVNRYPELKEEWILSHHDIPVSAYVHEDDIRNRFDFKIYQFEINAGDQGDQAKQAIHDATQQFIEEYISAFRQEVKAFCQKVIDNKGVVHGKTVNMIMDKIDRFKNMNIFDDNDIVSKLSVLKDQLLDAKGVVLKNEENASIAAALSDACKQIHADVDNTLTQAEVANKAKRRILIN